MKTYVIMIAKNFPQTHERKGDKTDFARKIKSLEKIHTIRGNYALWKKRFEKIEKGEACLSLREWEGLPRRSNQIELLRLDKTNGIGLEKVEISYYHQLALVFVKETKVSISSLSRNDGLSVSDFMNWFPDPSLSMALIHFTDFRYSP